MKKVQVFQDVSFKLLGTDVTTDVTDKTVINIAGYASVFLNPDGSRLIDRDNESVALSLLNLDNYKKNPILVYNHDWGDVAGKVTLIEKRPEGLYVEAEVHKFTGREQVFEAVGAGIIKTFSIGFVPKAFNYIEATDTLEISEAELVELSLAPVPSNQDALFTVTGTKSLSVDPQVVKSQNDMSCDELNGMCKIKKGKGMKKSIEGGEENPTPTEQPQAEEKPKEQEVPKVEPKAEVKPQAEEKPKEEPKVSVEPEDKDSLSVEDLAAQIVAAQQLAEEKAREAEEKAKLELEEKEKQRVAEEEQRVKDALSYIKEQKEVIEGTAAADLDTEELDELYELLTTTAEAIEAKVIEAVQAAQSA